MTDREKAIEWAQHHDPNEISTVYVPDDAAPARFDMMSFAQGVFVGAAAVAFWAAAIWLFWR